MEPWALKARDLILQSLAPSTRVSYGRKVDEFLTFCREHEQSAAWPLPVCSLLRFMHHLFERGLSPRSIAVYLSALAFEAGCRGVADTTLDARARRMLEGMRRGRPGVPDKHRPVTTDILKGLVRVFRNCCSSQFEASLFRAATLVIFFGAFRIGEALVRSRTADPHWVLAWADLSLYPLGCTLRLRRAKTDQRARGVSVTLGALRRHPLCPIRALNDYRDRVLHWVGPLFQHADGEPLTMSQFRAVFSWAIFTLGYSTRLYSVHSLRIGAATLAAELGLPEEVIRRIGRWRSAAFKYYLRR